MIENAKKIENLNTLAKAVEGVISQ